ncbi:hypothetical protein J2X97_000332 [Epilithonimonas hungarica]|uniref:hypothetical protein n=1 Tax=Epilithonimonas hungarica TaxID=454006 RepID=UPI00278A0B76|nr:hypothetical protein [Epilithonimonas hungarica]MDP9954695.1 hypothetical protein [Epilithonimonas hungarica]
MKIKVGQYELVTSEEFKMEKEAVNRFLEHFPDANPEKAIAKVKPYFKKNAESAISVRPAEASSTGQDKPTGENIKGGGEKKPSRKSGSVK